jgi:SAM-dependent methyltransferase
VTAPRLGDVAAGLSERAWALAALSAALDSGLGAALAEPAMTGELAARTGLEPAVAERLLGVLEALGLATRDDGGVWDGRELAAELGERERFVRADVRNAALQSGELAASAARGDLGAGWTHTDRLVLETQGEMSAGAVEPLVRYGIPALPGLTDRLGAPGAALLDIGTGVAALAIEFCRHFEHLRVVGLEPAAAPRALALARVADAGLAGRIEVRDQRVEELADVAAFDLAFVPLPFLPPAAVAAALAVVHRALRPGGWLLVGTLGSPARGDLRDALGALRSVLWGGGPLGPEAVTDLLHAAGYADVAVRERSPAGFTPMVARRP